MFFKLNETETVELKYSFRSAIYFEQIAGHSIDFTKLNANDLITLFYCVVIASLQKAKKPVITMLEFMDCIDEYNGGDKYLTDFAEWYISVIKKQFELLAEEKEGNKEKPLKEGKKKKA